MQNNKLTVIELFAGVGGFRLGLENTGHYETVWSNQWEPSTKVQHASMVYVNQFGATNHSNESIEEVIEHNFNTIPDHDVLVGGFPCQDYSVASTLKNSKGLVGKKGVLWWSIYNILQKKTKKPQYLILENVDRLLTSPSKDKGRDFAIMLRSLSDLGYIVEWRVINAAEYGMPQKRKRVFILAYHETSKIYDNMKGPEWITYSGTVVNEFKIKNVKQKDIKSFQLDQSVEEISEKFNNYTQKPFLNTGLYMNGVVYTVKTTPDYNGDYKTLESIVDLDEKQSSEFYIDENDLDKWKYLKGAKKIERKASNGYEYTYSEGAMSFPDPLNKPCRTIITGEGGKGASRSKHVIQDDYGLRRLTPIELERANMFPDDFTKLNKVSDSKRAFLMGNALVVGIVEKLGESLYNLHNSYKSVDIA